MRAFGTNSINTKSHPDREAAGTCLINGTCEDNVILRLLVILETLLRIQMANHGTEGAHVPQIQERMVGIDMKK